MEKQQITLTILGIDNLQSLMAGGGGGNSHTEDCTSGVLSGSIPALVRYKITIPRNNGRTEIYGTAKVGEEVELNDIYTYEESEE